jgi:hypothetical protein
MEIHDPYEECVRCGRWHYTHGDEKHTFEKKEKKPMTVYQAIVFMQPRQKPVTLFAPEINLELMNGLVMGYIERAPCYGNLVELDKHRIDIWCNEEGKLMGMVPTINVIVDGNVIDIICGPIMLCSNDDDGHSIGLTGEQHKIALKVLEDVRMR